MGIGSQVFQLGTHVLHVVAGRAHAHRFHRGDALCGEQGLGVDDAQSKGRVVARGLAHRLVVVEDGEAGLHRVLVDRTARLGDGHAVDVVVVDHQPVQEQVADLVDAERRCLRLVAAFGHVRVQEAQGGFLVAMVGQHGIADAHGDGQHHDVVLLDEILRQVAGRIDHYSYAHEAPPGMHRRTRRAT